MTKIMFLLQLRKFYLYRVQNRYSFYFSDCYCSYQQFDMQIWRKGGRRGGLMVSALDSRASAPGLSPGRGHCVVFLGKTLNSHSASLHPGIQMGTSELLGKT